MPMLRATADVAGASVYLGLLRLTKVPSRSAEFVMDSLEVAEAIMPPYAKGARLGLCREFGVPRRLTSVPAFNATPVTSVSLTE